MQDVVQQSRHRDRVFPGDDQPEHRARASMHGDIEGLQPFDKTAPARVVFPITLQRRQHRA